MDRRRALLALLATVGAAAARAQAPQSAHIGFLFTPARATSQVPGLFEAAMRDIGWVEGRNLRIDWRFAEGRAERLTELATELAQSRVQVIVAPTNIEAAAARRATAAIPIVTLFAIDPVGAGFAGSLARPGGNVTGVLYADPGFTAKSVEIMKEAVPSIRRFGYLYPTAMVGIRPFLEEMETTARAMGLSFHAYAVERREDIAGALEAIRRDGIDALRMAYSGVVQAGTPQILEFAAAHRIATSFSVPTAVERGGLMAYSPRLADNAARGAALVDKLLKRAAPAELSFEYPTRYELTVNVGTAKRLGIALPQSILLRADRLIE